MLRADSQDTAGSKSWGVINLRDGAGTMRDVRVVNDAAHLRALGSAAHTTMKVRRYQRLIVKKKDYKPARGQGGARVRG